MSLTIQDGLHHKSAYKSCRTSLSEIFFSLLGCHQKFLLDNLRGRRALGCEDELEVANDLIDDLMVFDKGDDPHLATCGGAMKVISFITDYSAMNKLIHHLKLKLVQLLCSTKKTCSDEHKK